MLDGKLSTANATNLSHVMVVEWVDKQQYQ